MTTACGEATEQVPAVCHLGGTARLQTVNERENPGIYSLLKYYSEYGVLSRRPERRRMGHVNYTWTDGTLYERATKVGDQ
jgi:carbamoyltransferase